VPLAAEATAAMVPVRVVSLPVARRAGFRLLARVLPIRLEGLGIISAGAA